MVEDAHSRPDGDKLDNMPVPYLACRKQRTVDSIALSTVALGWAATVAVVLAGEPRDDPILIHDPESPRTIAVEPFLTVGERGGPGMICSTIGIVVARDAAARTYVASGCNCGEVDVFGPGGEYERSVGTCGQGPGELEHVTDIATAADRLIVSGVPARVHAYAPDLTLSLEARLPRSVRVVAGLSDGTTLLKYRSYLEPGRVGLLHLHEATGGFLRTIVYADEIPGKVGFGADGKPSGRVRFVQADDSVWEANQFWRYRLVRWPLGGGAPTSFIREADWFPDYETVDFLHFRPWIADITAREGLLWTVGGYPDEWIRQPTRDGVVPPQHTVIEAIDPRSREVVGVGRAELGFTLRGWADSETVWTVREADDLGTIVVDLYRVSMDGPG